MTEALEGYGFPVLKARTIHREVYARTAADGLTVYHDKAAAEAIAEMDRIKAELLEVLSDGV